MSDASPTPTPELLTTKQAAAYLGCGERSLWRWSRCGVCPEPVSIGRGPRPSVRYRRRDLDQWIESGCQPINRGVTHG